MADSKVEIQLPEKLIGDTIRAELVAALAKNGGGDKWIQCIVEHALKKETEYGRSNVFRDAVNAMILEEAKKAIEEWLTQNREAIHKALLVAMDKNKRQNLKRVVDGMISGLVEVTPRVSLALDAREDRKFCNQCGHTK